MLTNEPYCKVLYIKTLDPQLTMAL